MCPADRSPSSDGQKVIIGGFLRIIPSKVHNGFDVRIDGEVIGSWVKDHKETHLITLSRTRPVKTSLNKFIQNKLNAKKLLILSTKVGLTEFHSVLNPNVNKVFNESFIRVYDSEKFLTDFVTAINKYRPYAVAIIGGGEESEHTMNIWEDAKVIDQILKTNYLVFSTVSHSNALTLLDKYADETFDGPIQFGHCLNEAVKVATHENRLTNKLKKITDSNQVLQKHNTDIDSELIMQENKAKKLLIQRNLLFCVMIMTVASVIAFMSMR